MKFLTLLACSVLFVGSFSACSTTSKKSGTASCCSSDSKSTTSCEMPAKKHKH